MTRGHTVGVIGAGIAGLACARELVAGGFDVTVFDKGRGLGGRTATRRAEPDLRFDHGAQFFTADDPLFREVTDDWLARGVVAEWIGRIIRLEDKTVIASSLEPRYVGMPGMSAMAVDLAVGLCVRTATQITAVTHGAVGWTIASEANETVGPFDTLVVTFPAPQTAALLGSHHFGAVASTVKMTPCWTVMAAFESRVELPWDGAFVHDSPLAWVARNSSKPGREREADCWVLQASPEWSADHLEAPADRVSKDLFEAFEDVIAGPLPLQRYAAAHRWRYGQYSEPDERRMLFDPRMGLAVCGDWLAGGRVEGAFLAGVRAAEAIREHREQELRDLWARGGP
ncbi:MAG: FAD-dependent oxidoreductase [Planctomycetales bacterium]|jgi:predicted NAD/FAD-dependent oxidoreductase|nr:FAD-dependent oxidoreductase [Planctomycetales bacterium]